MTNLTYIIEWLGWHLLKVAEEEFIKAEPAIQAKIVEEMQGIFSKIDSWLKNKNQA